MEVTKNNFSALFPKIKDAIAKSDFVAIDCELTGLNSGLDINAYDTQQQYYEKVRTSSKNFLIIQYGICIFRYDRDLEIFKQQGYNFYIFPRPVNKHVPDHRFLCQASSIDFLITQGFDFNKLFKDGISYLNTNEQERYSKSLKDAQKVRATQMENSFSPQKEKPYISVSIADRTFVEDAFKRIEEFIASDKEELVLPKCNSYLRRLMYNEADTRLANRANLETRRLANKDSALVVTRFKSKENKEEMEKKTIMQEEEEFQNCIGFTEVIKCIVSSGKLVVGHNMCLDILHTINQFLSPLPEDYEEFKELAHYSFSNILDTKYMCNAEMFNETVKSSVLPHLFQTIQEAPFVIPEIEIEEEAHGYQLNSDKAHEAGYDAYITAICFVAMWNHLGEKDSMDPFINMSLLDQYKNKLFLMRLQDFPYIHLGGKDPKPPRDHVLYITFPKEWKLSDIIQLFSPFGNVHVAWINDHSAYVGLHKRDQAAIALSTLSQSDSYTVSSFARRSAFLSGNTLFSSSPIVANRKRLLNDEKTTVKKRRTASFGESSIMKSNRSILPIIEDPEELTEVKFVTDDDVGIPMKKLMESTKTNKTFEVPGWD